jgi:hypothetical protein
MPCQRAIPKRRMRERVGLKSPVRENRPPGSVRGAPGNRRPYRDGTRAFMILSMHDSVIVREWDESRLQRLFLRDVDPGRWPAACALGCYESGLRPGLLWCIRGSFIRPFGTRLLAIPTQC